MTNANAWYIKSSPSLRKNNIADPSRVRDAGLSAWLREPNAIDVATTTTAESKARCLVH